MTSEAASGEHPSAEGPRPARGEAACAWCGRLIAESPGGRRRRYCRRSCRQRAYEQRQSLKAMELPEGAVVLNEAEISDLMDRMFQVRAACEDLATAIDEDADPAELKSMAHDLVVRARDTERLR